MQNRSNRGNDKSQTGTPSPVCSQEDLARKLAAFKGETITNSDRRIGKSIEGIFTRSSYRIDEKIGEGGVGIVYRAKDKDGNDVAVKFLSEDYNDYPEIRERFKREAIVMHKIDHPNSARILDVGNHDECLFFVMELLEGRDLFKDIAKGPLEPKTVHHIALQACDALEAAHEKGIIHRDVKAENIVLTTRDDDKFFVKVIDFGLAIDQLKHGDKSRLTATGTTFGTPQYMSKEHMESAKDADRCSDVYSLGVTLYLALCGEFPFDGKNLIEIYTNIMKGPPRRPSELVPGCNIPKELEDIVMKAISWMPQGRYQTMKEMNDALKGCDLSSKDWSVAPETPGISVRYLQPGAKTDIDPDVKRTTQNARLSDPRKGIGIIATGQKSQSVMIAQGRQPVIQPSDHSSPNKKIGYIAAIALIIGAAAAGAWYYLNRDNRPAEQKPENTMIENGPVNHQPSEREAPLK